MPPPKNRPRSASRPTKKARRSWLSLIFPLALLVAVGMAGAVAWWATKPIPMREAPIDVHIPSGASVRAAVRVMRASGIELDANLFVLLAKIRRSEAGIKAGSYEFPAGVTPWGLLTLLSSGKVSQAELTIPEGWTFRQVRARIDAHPELRHDTLGMSEAEIAKRLGHASTSLEGWLFPDTYLADKHSSDFHLYERAYRVMQQRLTTIWENRAPGLPLKTPHDALVLASIVEKETGKESDRKLVAAVFVNRLKRGMLLQTDPTVIYGLGESFDGNLRRRDLETDTPYNTYTRAGLPPTPIAMPGLASLEAATHPAKSTALYFVARGDGSSQFSDTLEAHNQAVRRYQLGGGR